MNNKENDNNCYNISIHFDNNSLLQENFGFQASSTSYWVVNVATSTSTLSIYRCLTGYTVTGITEFLYVYALATTAIIRFDSILYTYTTYNLPSTTTYNVPMMYLNYPGTITGVNYASGTQVGIITETGYITFGFPCSTNYALTATNTNTSTTSTTLPTASAIPTLTAVASIDGGNTAAFSSYPLTVTSDTQCTSTFELVTREKYPSP